MSLSSLKSGAKTLAAHFLQLSGHLKRRASEKDAWRILMYHRINEPELLGHPMQPGMYVRPESFEMQMRFLKENYNVVRLEELSQDIIQGKKITAGTIAITFDDGWLDNYTAAFPILRRYELPATVFLATKYIGSEQTLWSDAVPYAIARLQEVNITELKETEKTHPELKRAVEQLLQSCTQNNALNILRLDSFLNSLKEYSSSEREEFAEELLANVFEIKKTNIPRAFLSWEEVAEMQSAGIDFACHTHAHVPLTELNAGKIKADIEQSLSVLKKQDAFNSNVFCYPEGKISAESQASLKEGNYFSSVVSTAKQQAISGTPSILPRIGIHDDVTKSPTRFAARIWEERLF